MTTDEIVKFTLDMLDGAKVGAKLNMELIVKQTTKEALSSETDLIDALQDARRKVWPIAKIIQMVEWEFNDLTTEWWLAAIHEEGKAI